jgi:hypothetical protein
MPASKRCDHASWKEIETLGFTHSPTLLLGLVIMIDNIFVFLSIIKALRKLWSSQRKNSEKLGRNRTLSGIVIFN